MPNGGNWPGDLYVQGALRADSMSLPNNSVGNAQVNSGSPLDGTKTTARYRKTVTQKRGVSIAANAGEPIHQVTSTSGATLVGFQASILVAGVTWAGGGQAVVDLKKNGSSVLSGTITIDGSTVIYTPVIGTFASTALVQNDVLEVVVTFTAGTGTPAQGLIVTLTLDEKP